MSWLDKNALGYFWSKIKQALSKKQDKLEGSSGQIIMFDADGKAVASDFPEENEGVTMAQVDFAINNAIYGAINEVYYGSENT